MAFVNLQEEIMEEFEGFDSIACEAQRKYKTAWEFGSHVVQLDRSHREDNRRNHRQHPEVEAADIKRRLLAGERPAWCTHGRGRTPTKWVRIAASIGITLSPPAVRGKFPHETKVAA